MNLFDGINENDKDAMLRCLDIKEKSYEKGDTVFRRGGYLSSVGVVQNGSVHMVKDDFWGNRSILGEASPGQMFGEVYACMPGKKLEVDVIAAEKTDVLFLDMQRILTVCSSACEFHTRLIHNLLTILAEKNLMLTHKIEHMAQKNTRDKLLSYLSMEAEKSGSAEFRIPFNRQQLADYLSVDRSAMSRELSHMKEEGILEYQRNRFRLISPRISS